MELSPLVLAVRGAPATPDRDAMAAVLDAGRGGCLSHHSVVARLHVPGYRPQPLHVWRVRNRSTHESRLAIQHTTRALPAHHMTGLRGIPVTTPARTFVDMAAHLSLGRAGRLLDDLWGRNLVSFHTIDQVIGDLSRQGRTGLVLARDLLHERGPGYRPPQTGLERRVMRLLEEAGLTGFERQVDTSGEEGWIGRVDFRHRTLPVILEVQSELYHEGLSNRRADAARIAALTRAGFVVVEVWEHDVWHRPDALLTRLRHIVRSGC